MAVVMGAFAVVLWAYEYGPNPGVCGVPGELGTCTQSQCHSGTTNNPANRGSLAIKFPNGLTYVPGVQQHLTVTISDPAPTQVAWGFEVTARQSSNPATMTGTFSPSDQYTQIMCSRADFNVFDVYCLPGAGQGCTFQSSAPACPANEPLQYMEHSYSGYVHTQGQNSGTYQFDWTPPSTNVGNITFYIAGNAGVGGQPTADNDHIYATTFTLAAGNSSNAPTISSGGVVSNATGLAGIGPNLYVNINGTDLSSATDVWDSFITNNNLPTQVDGVSVSIGGKAAYVEYVSPTRIQVLTPPDLGLGTMAVQVTNSNGTSASVSVTSQQFAPGFFEWQNNQPVATHAADSSDAMKNGTYSGLTTVPAKPGEYITFWGSGFGPTTPAIPNGTLVPITDGPYYVTNVPLLTINGQPMTYYGTALAPTFAGLYQATAQVPISTANGDWPVIAIVGGISSPTGVVLTVHN
jgi:uncharacterized protein (TIGR03437 family)